MGCGLGRLAHTSHVRQEAPSAQMPHARGQETRAQGRLVAVGEQDCARPLPVSSATVRVRQRAKVILFIIGSSVLSKYYDRNKIVIYIQEIVK